MGEGEGASDVKGQIEFGEKAEIRNWKTVNDSMHGVTY